MSEPFRCVAFDLETTGIDPFADVPVSYAFVESRLVDGHPVASREVAIVNPGRPIPAGASAVHGISDAVASTGIALGDAVAKLSTTIAEVWDGGGAIVGMNVAYDLTMLNTLCSSFGLPDLISMGPGPVVDVMVIDRHFDKYRKGPRKLSDLCDVYGISLTDAHSADADAEASLQIFFEQQRRYPEVSALAANGVNSSLQQWYGDWLSGLSDYFVRQGKKPIEPGRFDWPIHTNR